MHTIKKKEVKILNLRHAANEVALDTKCTKEVFKSQLDVALGSVV